MRGWVRVAGACAAYPIDEGVVRLIGPHHGHASDLEPVLAHHPLPHGRDAIHLAGQVFALFGLRKDITFAEAGQEHEPGEPIVLAAGDRDLPAGGLGWTVLPPELAISTRQRWLSRIARRARPTRWRCWVSFDSSSLAMVGTYNARPCSTATTVNLT